MYQKILCKNWSIRILDPGSELRVSKENIFFSAENEVVGVGWWIFASLRGRHVSISRWKLEHAAPCNLTTPIARLCTAITCVQALVAFPISHSFLLPLFRSSFAFYIFPHARPAWSQIPSTIYFAALESALHVLSLNVNILPSAALLLCWR